MFVKRNFGIKRLFLFTWHHIVWLSIWGAVPVLIHNYAHEFWFSVPWLPVSLIGVAVAFFVGFKNNAAYERLWEARKIWGAIVNSSRAWGSISKAYVTNIFRNAHVQEDELHKIHQRLIYRHIAWLYTLRGQLLQPTSWEHLKGGSKGMTKITSMRRKAALGDFDTDSVEQQIEPFLKEMECDRAINAPNVATAILDYQSQDLKKLREEDLIDDFRHMEMQKVINDFYIHQGKCERIKKYPFPRQYGSISFYFVGIFIILLPFGLLPEFDKLGHELVWLNIPFTLVVGWVFLMMELVGDYSENPFEGLGNDIPMNALCRTIEIDLRAMLGESDLPPNIEAVNGVLM